MNQGTKTFVPDSNKIWKKKNDWKFSHVNEPWMKPTYSVIAKCKNSLKISWKVLEKCECVILGSYFFNDVEPSIKTQLIQSQSI